MRHDDHYSGIGRTVPPGGTRILARLRFEDLSPLVTASNYLV